MITLFYEDDGSGNHKNAKKYFILPVDNSEDFLVFFQTDESANTWEVVLDEDDAAAIRLLKEIGVGHIYKPTKEFKFGTDATLDLEGIYPFLKFVNTELDKQIASGKKEPSNMLQTLKSCENAIAFMFNEKRIRVSHFLTLVLSLSGHSRLHDIANEEDEYLIELNRKWHDVFGDDAYLNKFKPKDNPPENNENEK